MDDFKSVKKIIENSQTINLLPSPKFQRDSFPATLALFYSLKQSGKNVNLLATHYPHRFNFLVKREEPRPPQNSFLISIKEAGAKLSQLFYEKTEGGLNLFLKTKYGELKKEDISLKPLLNIINPIRDPASNGTEDILITVGIEKLGEVEGFLKTKPDTLINIDNQLSNENYGQLNLVEISTSTLSEIIFDLLNLMGENLFDVSTSNALLCGVIYGTSNFQSGSITPQIFQKISYLMEKGADFKGIITQLYKVVDKASLQIFGKILTRIELSEPQDTGWILLKKEDFTLLGTSPSALKYGLEKLSSGLFPFQNFIMLWEAESSSISVRGIFYSPNQRMLEKVLASFGGEKKGQGVLFHTKEIDLRKVKAQILEVINL